MNKPTVELEDIRATFHLKNSKHAETFEKFYKGYQMIDFDRHQMELNHARVLEYHRTGNYSASAPYDSVPIPYKKVSGRAQLVHELAEPFIGRDANTVYATSEIAKVEVVSFTRVVEDQAKPATPLVKKLTDKPIKIPRDPDYRLGLGLLVAFFIFVAWILAAAYPR